MSGTLIFFVAERISLHVFGEKREILIYNALEVCTEGKTILPFLRRYDIYRGRCGVITGESACGVSARNPAKALKEGPRHAKE